MGTTPIHSNPTEDYAITYTRTKNNRFSVKATGISIIFASIINKLYEDIMKKKGIMSMVIVIAISTANVRTVINAVNSNNQTNLSLESIETMSSEESGSGGCYAGGRGSNECSIQAGIDIVGSGTSIGCSVSCKPRYYACCSVRCTCIRE